jgi:hypothetical protein
MVLQTHMVVLRSAPLEVSLQLQRAQLLVLHGRAAAA